MGGGSYSYDWSNSVRNRKIAGSGYYQTGDSHKYAKYDIQKGPLIPQISFYYFPFFYIKFISTNSV